MKGSLAFGLLRLNARRHHTTTSQPPLRISFDLDDTLICYGSHVPTEKGVLPAFIHRRLTEPLRHGTRSLIRELRRHGHSVWIYTSSGRNLNHIRRWSLLHGIRVDGVVNATRHHHTALLNGGLRWPSKYPPAFGIDLHIDDSEGVGMEGAEHGFRVLVVGPEDRLWAHKVLKAATRTQFALSGRRSGGGTEAVLRYAYTKDA